MNNDPKHTQELLKAELYVRKWQIQSSDLNPKEFTEDKIRQKNPQTSKPDKRILTNPSKPAFGDVHGDVGYIHNYGSLPIYFYSL